MFMLRIRIDLGNHDMERYLNKKSYQGYQLMSLTPFDLFVPLRIIFYKFKKVNQKRYIYKVMNTCQKEMKDQGWEKLKDNYLGNSRTIIYQSCINKPIVHTDSKDSYQLIIKGCWLLCIYVILMNFIPMPYYGTNIWGFFLHYAYVIIALGMIAFGIIDGRRKL